MTTKWRPVPADQLVRCGHCGVEPLYRLGRRLVVVTGDAQGGYAANIYHRHECLAKPARERTKDMAAETGALATRRTAPPIEEPDIAALLRQTDERAVLAWLGTGDLSGLSPAQIKSLYASTCASLGINPLTRPFDLLKTRPTEAGESAKLVMYPNKGAAEQLGKRHGINARIVSRQYDKEIGLYTVVCRVWERDGRAQERSGVVALSGDRKDGSTYSLSGQRLADKIMAAETKSFRRATLALLGLGGLVGGEEESAVPVQVDWDTGEIMEQTPEPSTLRRAEAEAVPAPAVDQSDASPADGDLPTQPEPPAAPPSPAQLLKHWTAEIQGASDLEALRAVGEAVAAAQLPKEVVDSLKLVYGPKFRELNEQAS